MSIKDGGSAFPSEGGQKFLAGNEVRKTLPSQGMSLRDYFAAKASDGDVGEVMSRYFDHDSDCYTISRQQARYICADAMLASRDKP